MNNPARERNSAKILRLKAADGKRQRVRAATPATMAARLTKPLDRGKSHGSQDDRRRPLHVLKFGGTSVGDSSCILQVGKIVRQSAAEHDLVLVVSAMSGVTNRLIEAGKRSNKGDIASAVAILDAIREQHEAAANDLIRSSRQRMDLVRKMRGLVDEGKHLCTAIAEAGELTGQRMDSVSSLGERLSAPLVTAMLADRGVKSCAIDATELIVTDSSHGGAEPLRGPTRTQCERRLHPFIREQIIPVVTGFIGATSEGILTTLGRGGSDYSATILADALDADEVVIWTDVDGMMSADPQSVENARTISEISYREAAALAHFGAKVLHPRTVHALTGRGIPLWIRNTFAPERSGTKITLAGSATDALVNGLTSIHDVTFVSVAGNNIGERNDVLGRISKVAGDLRPSLLLFWDSSSRNCIRLTVPSEQAYALVDVLNRELAPELALQTVERISVDLSAAVVTLVGKNIQTDGIAGRSVRALGRDGIEIIAIARASGSDCNLSLAVPQGTERRALNVIHRELRL